MPTQSLVAILSRSGRLDAEDVRRMLAASPHRGRETRTTALGRALLGVSWGDGPGSADLVADAELAAAFTGFLDNLDELCAELERRGLPVHPRTPAVALKVAFRAFGDEAPGHLRGAFAGVVTDGRTIWAFRDHVGLRPLVYREDPRGVFIATEPKQIAAGAGISYQPDLEVVERTYYGRMEGCWRSAIQGVQRLPDATVLRADGAGCRLRRYWNPEHLLETARLSPADVEARFHELMHQAVERTLVGDDVLSLSGGIDSPAIAAYAAPIHLRRTGRPLPCQSALYPRFPSVDESRYIRAVAEHFQLPLRTYESQARATDRLLDWARLCDGPFPVLSLNEMLESLEQARTLGFRNMLTGEFAEYVCDLRDDVVPHLLRRGRVFAAARLLSSTGSDRSLFRALSRNAFRAFIPLRLRSLRRRWMGRADPSVPAPDWLDRRNLNSPWVPDGRRWRELQLYPLRGPAVSLEADERVQAVAGVSTRRPWADVDLWEFFLSLPAHVKFPEMRRKGLIRRLLRGKVPDVILDRRDKTFFDQAILAGIDYATLRAWLSEPRHRIDGVNYALLVDRLERGSVGLVEYMWAKDLAAVHAFLSLWDPPSSKPSSRLARESGWMTA